MGRPRTTRGEHEEAERLAREAVAISSRTDAPIWHGDALYDLAEVLQLAGRTDEAAAAFEQAFEQYERKRALPLVEQTRARLDLRAAPNGTVPRGLSH